jgi:hypothetical protein
LFELDGFPPDLLSSPDCLLPVRGWVPVANKGSGVLKPGGREPKPVCCLSSTKLPESLKQYYYFLRIV